MHKVVQESRFSKRQASRFMSPVAVFEERRWIRMKKDIRSGRKHSQNINLCMMVLMLIILAAAGCGSKTGSAGAAPTADSAENNSGEAEKADTASASGAEKAAAATEESTREETEKAAEEAFAEETEASEEKTENVSPEETEAEGMPLYRRLCGKYSRPDGTEEYDTIEIGEFGGNLYAFCADAMGDEKADTLEIYSYWAMEIFPEAAEDLLSEDANAFRAGVMEFSNMSNLGKYWGPPSAGTIRLEDGNLIFEDFGPGFPFGDGSPKLIFEPDERVEDTFIYSNTDSTVPPDDFAGFWKEKGSEVPLFLEFTKDHNLRIRQKDPAAELVLCCGGYQMTGESSLKGRLNFLGDGSIPIDLDADIQVRGNDLIMTPGPEDAGSERFGRSGELVFERISRQEIPIITLAEIPDEGWGEGTAAGENVEMEFDLADSYMDLLFRYKKAQDGAYSQEQVEELGLDTELVQHAWPWAADNDEVRYLLLNIDDADPFELVITYRDHIIDIYGSDGRRLNYAYGTPYRGEAELCEGGLLKENYLPSMNHGSTTWYRYDTGMGGFFPVFGAVYDLSGENAENVRYCTYPYELKRNEIAVYYEKNGRYPEWIWDQADEITEAEYNALCSDAHVVDVSDGIKIADFRGL